MQNRLSAGSVAAALVLTALVGALAPVSVSAATPPSGTISDSNPSESWDGALISGANVDASTCVYGVTCDTYELTLAAGDYTDQRIQVRIEWLLPANDYDLNVYEGTLGGPLVGASGEFATTFEETVINVDAVIGSDRVYVIEIVAWSVAPGDPHGGTASLVAVANPRTPVYTAGSITFSENVPLKIPVAAQDGEPSVRVDVDGNCYVGAIRGVPAGVDLWRFDLDPDSPTFDPGMQSPAYLGQPDAFLQQDPFDTLAGGADGGGDIEISVSFPSHPDSTPVLTITSLAAANISSAVSHDRGGTFTLSPAVAIVPADDRQWNESTGDSRVYLIYRAPIPATGLFMAVSDDNGFTYPLQSLINPSGTSPGYLDVDHSSGNVYVVHQSGSSSTLATSFDGGLTWRNNTLDNSTGHGTLFDVVKVGEDGTVYSVWSDGTDIYLSHSTDAGLNWATPARVNDNGTYKTNLFPWMEAGSDGRVGVVWYGTTHTANDNDADWEILYSVCLNAKDQSPVFQQQVVSDHIIHASNISTGGLTGADNRNLIDYFQIALDPQGAAVVAFTDDHNDFSGHTMVSRQLDGPSLYAGANGTGTVAGVYPPPLPAPDPLDPEVSDFLHDAVTGLLIPIATDNAFDILSVDYTCEIDSLTMETLLVAAIQVSSLDTIPAGINWRANFTANAPGGVSDRGDQFYLRASAETTPITYTWGTAVRNGDGSLTYTEQGPADAGSIDAGAGTVTMKIRLSQLNTVSLIGPAVDEGTVFHGLRGATFTPGANAVRDITRGGSSFSCSGVLSAPGYGDRTPAASFLDVPNPNPTRKASSVRFAVDRAGFVELSVFDIQGRRVRSIQAGNLAAGEYTRDWDGRTDRFSDAPAGIYFYVLNVAGGTSTRKITLMR